jgi:hypothetical protein
VSVFRSSSRERRSLERSLGRVVGRKGTYVEDSVGCVSSRMSFQPSIYAA